MVFETEIEALGALFDFIVAFPDLLYQVLVGLLMCLLYPVSVGVRITYLVFDYAYQGIALFLNQLLDIPRIFIELVNSFFAGSFPSFWIWAFGILLMLRVLLRVYKVVKGMSIFGWSL